MAHQSIRPDQEIMFAFVRKSYDWFSREQVGGLLLRGASIAFSVSVLSALALFVERFVLARLLGVEVFGQYTYVYSWVTVLAFLGGFGMDTVALRYVAKYAGQQDWPLLKGFLGYSLRRTVRFSIVVSLGMVGIVWLLRGTLEASLVGAFLVGGLLLVAMALAQLIAQQLLSLKHIFMAQAPAGFLRSLVFMLGAAVVAGIIGVPADAPLVMLINLGAVVVLLLLSWVYMQQHLPDGFIDAAVQLQPTEWNRAAWQNAIINFVNIFNKRSDILILGFFLGTTEAGIYSIAVAITMLVDFGLVSVNTVVAPMIAEYYAQGQLASLQRLLTTAVSGVTAYVLAACFLLIVWGEPVLRLFGPDFVAAYPPLVILLIGKIVHSMFGPTGFMMTMTGRERQAARISVLSTVLSLVLSLVLIPILGAVGVALANTLRLILWNVLIYMAVRKQIGVDPSILSLRGFLA